MPEIEIKRYDLKKEKYIYLLSEPILALDCDAIMYYI